MADYSARRSDPNDEEGTSRLSPYLHFGQISPAEVARTALASPYAAETEKFIDELVTWRELSLNFCLRNPNHGTLEALPEWVHKAMAKHAGDIREATYTLEQFERAETHDELWNAAQRELELTGVMHNVVRMLWGKTLILWSAHYADALAWLVHLNNKYGLDGRDPSSYGGIQWCFGKFDRPFYDRPVFGVIRPMSIKRAREKWDADRYIRRWLRPRGGAQTGLPLFTSDCGHLTSRLVSLRRRAMPVARVRMPRGRLACHRHRRLAVGERCLAQTGGRAPACFPPFTADGGHVRTITAHDFAALATRIAGLIARPFVRRPLFVRRATPLAGDLALAIRVHRCEPALALASHGLLPFQRYNMSRTLERPRSARQTRLMLSPTVLTHECGKAFP